jgi:tetratricopeptide (TPR) repeat protein
MAQMTLQALWQAAESAEKQKDFWQAIELYSQILGESTHNASEPTTQQLRLKTLANRGRLLAIVGEPAAALAGYEQYYRETRNSQDMIEALLLIGWQCTRMGFYDRAYTALENALNQATELQFHSGRARALARLGGYWQELGRYADALRYLEQAELLVEYVESSRGRMRITNALGNAYWGLGQLDKAIVAYNRALAHARLVGNEETAMILNNLSETCQAMYDMEQAYHYQTEALQLIQDSPFSHVRADLFRNMGVVLCQLGRIDEGVNYLNDALPLSRTLKQINVEMQVLYSLALT